MTFGFPPPPPPDALDEDVEELPPPHAVSTAQPAATATTATQRLARLCFACGELPLSGRCDSFVLMTSPRVSLDRCMVGPLSCVSSGYELLWKGSGARPAT